eukprot:TRINITY_DN6855_c0_g1_i1.p2 TRINITY_DN6855_c0_g1~~TRINITY_DN6855_c0_g1_i1.p2  ORF type:complete len:87 (+),score=36.89 TRINITY_DN6855_c0_g1_i1:133-393(+)
MNMPHIMLHKSKSLQIDTNERYNQKKSPSREIAANVSHQAKQDFNEKKIRDFYSLEVSDNLTCNFNKKKKYRLRGRSSETAKAHRG